MSRPLNRAICRLMSKCEIRDKYKNKINLMQEKKGIIDSSVRIRDYNIAPAGMIGPV